MSQFADFDRQYGPPTRCTPADAEAVRAYQGVLPEELLDTWRTDGWCAYGDGLLWLTDPRSLAGVLDDWGEFEPGRAVVFLRTAFAHLYFWSDGHAYSLDVQTGGLSQVTDDIRLLFTLLCDPDVRAKMLREDLFRAVRGRLGPPAADECYAFVPALPLGGPGTADTVQRAALREHLGLLAQLALE